MRSSPAHRRPEWATTVRRTVFAVVLVALGVASSAPRPHAAQARPPDGPTLQFREASGCGGLLLYAWNDARTEVLIIRIDQTAVTIKNGTTDLEIRPTQPAVTASLEVSETPRETFPYCDESATATEKATVWTAVAGKVKLIVKRRPGAAFTPVSVGVDRLVVQGPDGQQVKQRRGIQFTAAIGNLR